MENTLDFLIETFEGSVHERLDGPDGRIGHAEVRVGDSLFMLGDVNEQWPATKSVYYVYVDDVDATHRRAVAAGGTPTSEPTDQFYGDRVSNIRDAWGNTWCIATHLEDLSAEEVARRAAALPQG